MDFITPSTLFFSLVGGILPAVLWLWFWLKEDAAHPEPPSLLLTSFLVGAFLVPIAFVFQKGILSFLGPDENMMLITAWAAVEESLKYFGAWVIAFRSLCINRTRCLDEPLDPIIYMITVALGFSACENTLFLITPVAYDGLMQGILTSNLRFIGASLVHVVSSASVGAALAFTFWKGAWVRRAAATGGIIIATVLHASFNFFILHNTGSDVFYVFLALWFLVIMLLIIFEKVKGIIEPSR